VRTLAADPHIGALAGAVRSVALAAAAAADGSFGRGGGTLDVAADAAGTPYGDVRELLERGARSGGDNQLLGALIALGIAHAPSELGRSELAGQLVWLAAHTPVDALIALDAALGDRAEAIWRDVAEVAVDPARPRAEALTAAAALRVSPAPAAKRAAGDAAVRASDPLVASVLAESGQASALAGEITPPPRHPALTVLLAVTGILLVAHGVRLVGRFALAYKRPARVVLSERGLEVAHRIELLGRVLRDREMLVPFDNLARVTREVRYPRVGLYAGLLALALGTYFGLGLLVDGVRVPGGSPPLLGLGLLLIALGIGIDFALTTLSDGVRGRCRLVVEPRKGRRVCVGNLDPASADRMLAALATQAR
jgi:hypothetical protein